MNAITQKAQPQQLSTSLQSMLVRKQEERTAQLPVCLICDTSGSMTDIARGERKITTLARTVNRLVKSDDCQIIAFSNSARFVESLDENAYGGTKLDRALKLALSRQWRKVIVISDGLPDSESESLRLAESFKCPISCIYVGPGDDEGYRFLKQLARRGKGQSAYTGDDTRRIGKAALLMLKK